MSDHTTGDSDRARRRPGDFQASVNRLERAVDDLVSTASDRFADRATNFIDETSDRLEREAAGRRRDRPARKRPRDRDTAREPYDDAATIPRKLYRDPVHQKLGGVCSGIARYYGVERWVVRCIAITGGLFFPTIVVPAYVIAYFVLDKSPTGNRRAPETAKQQRHGRHDHRSPAPELGPRLSPRYSLRNVQADLTEVELRLRRMESHVTSGRYELQREFSRIEEAGHEPRV
jgi:phage shock protein C